MKYRFKLTYTPTDGGEVLQRECYPVYGDDLVVDIEKGSDAWYYTRKLDGKLVFCRGDYAWIMGCEFDGTFRLDVLESHDNGRNWYDYFDGTFSRASMEIDEDNKSCTLNGLSDNVEDLIKNGGADEYDLMKLIPDSMSKEVQGQVPPALAMVDWRSEDITKSDLYCGGPATGNGYKSGKNDYNIMANAGVNPSWLLVSVCAEAQVVASGAYAYLAGRYAGVVNYSTRIEQGAMVTSVNGTLRNADGCSIVIGTSVSNGYIYATMRLDDADGVMVTGAGLLDIAENTTGFYTPASYVFRGFGHQDIEKVEVLFHYIRATLLTYSTEGANANVLDTGDYYKGMLFFNNAGGGLVTAITTNTVEEPNGHRMVPGSDEGGGVPQYFAEPDDTEGWIPLAEDNWNYASMWYKLTPSVSNGLLDPLKVGTFAWSRCWTIGACLQALLKRITGDKVVFAETEAYSRFLYGFPNPVAEGEPMQWLVTQKSNVMTPGAGGASARRCVVRLDWFLELLRNAFNCYYWLERRNDGRYDFRVEHVEYFRRGGAYQGSVATMIDLTVLKPMRNFLRGGVPAKRYADQTNKYTFDLEGMVEKYTFSWQGDGGGDDFKGNPMFFKAGWIAKGTSEDRQVDNIFADLGWLMLNAGTDTSSSKNYDGLFLFGGYRPFDTEQWKENKPAISQYLNNPRFLNLCVTLSARAGHTITYEYYHPATGVSETVATYTGTGEKQTIVLTYNQSIVGVVPRLNFGGNYQVVTIHRVQTQVGNVYRVPNVENRLRSGNYLQNGVLAWPWLQCEYLHYDVPAAKWSYNSDDPTDAGTEWETDGTIKMVRKQTVGVVPLLDASAEKSIMGIVGVKTGLGVGIVESARVNLGSRNAEMTLMLLIC